VIATGDSMMSPLDVFLTDRLRPRAQVRTFVRIGTALSKPDNTWISDARKQARRLRPRATVVFLGANDGFDMRTPEGRTVVCCRPDWLSEYSRRVKTLMRAYRRGGRGRVLWLTLPAPRSELRKPYAAAANFAARAAAREVPGTTIVPLDEVFTPGFQYRATMPYRGRLVRVRHTDGIHLSLAGSRIAERIVERALSLPRR
jgi:hypothetical protein